MAQIILDRTEKTDPGGVQAIDNLSLETADGEFMVFDVPPFLLPLKVPVADLAEVPPYAGFIQAKFFEIDETLADLHIPWADIERTLLDGGYAGRLSSE